MKLEKFSKKMHIVIYSKLDKHGGGRETWADYFLENIYDVKEFNNINIYCLGSEDYSNTLIEKFKHFENINFFPVEVKKDESKYHRINNFIQYSVSNLKKNSNDGDVVLFLGTVVEGMACLVTRFTIKHKLKLITWIRSIGLKEIAIRENKISVLVLSLIEKSVFKNSDAIIFNGKDTFEYYRDIYNNFICKMHIVENGVDYNLFSKIGKIKLNHNCINISYIGRFNKEKGFYDFLNSINLYNSKLKKEVKSKISFEIWGFGTEFDIPKNTIYKGILKRENIVEVMKKNHIIVFLNLSNSKLAGGLSHGLLEALASGRICVAYDNPAHNQVLNQSNSILVPEGDIERLSNVYIEIIKDITSGNSQKYIELSKNSLESSKQYSIQNHINKFIKVYNSI